MGQEQTEIIRERDEAKMNQRSGVICAVRGRLINNLLVSSPQDGGQAIPLS